MKVVLNKCFGGFSLSDEACEWLISNRNWKVTKFTKKGNYCNDKADLCLMESSILYLKYSPVKYSNELRINKDVIDCVEELKEKASGELAELKIVEIPDEISWEVDDYDGMESIHETHRSW